MAKHITNGWEQLAASARFDCKEFAKLQKVSLRQLQRVFRAKLGRTPQEWLNEQRLTAAGPLLISGRPVKMVASELGFKQASHFCRQFKKSKMLTPGQFANVAQG